MPRRASRRARGDRARLGHVRGWRRGLTALLVPVLVATLALTGLVLVRPPSASAGTGTSADGALVLTTSATPTSLPLGGGTVTYSYQLRNAGTEPLYYISSVDNRCPSVSYVSGMSVAPWGDYYLPAGATARWTCTTTVTQTTANTATFTFDDYYGTVTTVSGGDRVVVETPGGQTCASQWYSSVNNGNNEGNIGIYIPATGQVQPRLMLTDATYFDRYQQSSAMAVSTANPDYVYFTTQDGRNFSGNLYRFDNTVASTAPTADRVSLVDTNLAAWSTTRLAASPDGRIWSLATNGHLYDYNPATDVTTDHGIPLSPAGMSFDFTKLLQGDIAFDGWGDVYILGASPTGQNYLFSIDHTQLAKTSGLQTELVRPIDPPDYQTTYIGMSFSPDGTIYATAVRGNNFGTDYYIIDETTGASQWLNYVQSTEIVGVVGDMGSCSLPKAELRLSKTVDHVVASAGGTLTYTITVRNIGDLSATGATFTDLAPAGTTYVSSTMNGRQMPGSTNPWAQPAPITGLTATSAGMVPVGDTVTIVMTVRVNATIAAGTKICNQGTGDFTGSTQPVKTDEPKLPSGDDPTCSQVPAPGIVVDKTANPDTVNIPGTGSSGPITYSYKVNNTGNEQLRDITLADDRCANPILSVPNFATYSGDLNGNGLLDLRETWIYTCSATVTRADATNIATARGTGVLSSLATSATDSFTVTVTNVDLNLRKSAGTLTGPTRDGSYAATYTLTVANTGDGIGSYGPIADSPRFAPELTPTGASWTGTASGSATGSGPTYYVGAAGTKIAPGVTHSYTVTVTFRYTGSTPAAACDGSPDHGLDNSAQLGPGLETGTTDDNTACLAPPPLPAPAATLAKTQGGIEDRNGNGLTDAGDDIRYTFAVRNTGNVPLYDVVVDDPRIALTGYPCAAELAAGGTASCSYSYRVTDADQDSATLTNTATARGTAPGGGAVSSAPDSASTPLASRPSLNAAKTVAAIDSTIDPATGRFRVSYTVTVSNAGDTPTTYGPLLDTPRFGPELTVQSATWSGQRSGTATGAGPYPLAPAGTPIGGHATHTYQVSLLVGYAGTTTPSCWGPGTGTSNEVSLPGEAGPSSDNSACAAPPAAPAPALSLDKTVSPGAPGAPTPIDDIDGNGVDVGDTLGYEFTVTNTGTVTLTSVTVSDPALAAQGLTVSCPTGPLAPAAQVSCSTLRAGTPADYALTVADLDAGQVLNTATARATAPVGPAPTATDGTSTPIPQRAGLQLVKAAGELTDSNGSGGINPGDTIPYTFTVTNTGTVTLTGLTLTDAKLGLLGAPCVASLAPGASATCPSRSYPITQADIEARRVDNTAAATGTPPSGPAVTSADSSTITPIPVVQSLHLVKTAGAVRDVAHPYPGAPVAPAISSPGVADPYDVVPYTFTVRNDSNVTLTDVVIDDPTLGLSGHTCVASLAPGDSATCTVDHALTIAEVDAGTLTNTATARSGSVLSAPSTATSTFAPDGELYLAKTGRWVDGNGNTRPDPGETVLYTFTVWNVGNVTLRILELNDAKIGLVNLKCAQQEISPGQSTVCAQDVPYTISVAEADTGTVENQASVNAYTPYAQRIVDVSDTGGATLTIPQLADIRLDKLADPATVVDTNGSGRLDAGDTIRYVFDVTNPAQSSNVSLTEVTVTDAKVGTVACPVSQLAPGSTVRCTAAPYVLTQADIDAGYVDNSATATGTPPGAMTKPTAADTLRVGPFTSTAALAVDKRALSIVDQDGNGVDAGDTVRFEIAVRNTGAATITDFQVNDPLLIARGVSLSCPSARIAPGNQVVCSTDPVPILQGDLDAGRLVNDATVTVTAVSASATAPPPVAANATVTLPRTTAVRLAKTATLSESGVANGRADAGDRISYPLTVTNSGTTTISTIAVSDPMIGPVTCLATTLAPGLSTTCTGASYLVTQGDIDDPAATLVNTATVSATGADGARVQDSATAPVTKGTQRSALLLAKSAQLTGDANSDGKAQAGDVVSYRFTLTNDGTRSLTAPVVEDTLLARHLLRTSAPPGFDGTLDPAEQVVLTATMTVAQGDVDSGDLVNTATAAAQAPDGSRVSAAQDSATVPAGRTAALTLTKTATLLDRDSSGGASLGDGISYAFLLRNTGDITLSATGIADQLLSDVGQSAQFATTKTTAGGGSAPADGTLQPGETVAASATYPITQRDVDAGAITNTATGLARKPDGSPVTSAPATATVTVARTPALHLTKTATDADGDGIVALGEGVRYAFVLTNTGNVALRHLGIRDPRLDSQGLLAAAPTGFDGVLDPGESVTLRAPGPYVVRQGDIDSGALPNTATGYGEAPGGDPANPADDVTDTAEALLATDTRSGLAIVTRVASLDDSNGNGVASLGETVTYAFDVTNTAAVTLTGVGITDARLAAAGVVITCPEPSLAGGATMTCTATPYRVVQADIDAGALETTATATGTPPAPATGSVTSAPSSAVVLVDGTAGLSLVKTARDASGDGRMQAGEKVRYEFRVSNTGAVTVHDLAIHDAMLSADPPNIAITCPTTPLAPGDALTCTSGDYTVTQADIDAGTLTNTATASGRTPANEPVRSVPASATLTAAATATLTLVKSAVLEDGDGDGLADLNERVRYTFEISNTGTATLSAVAVRDSMLTAQGVAVELPAGFTTLAPGASVTGTARYVVRQADIDRGDLVNTATAAAERPRGDLANPADDVLSPAGTATVRTDRAPGLAMTKDSTIADANADGLAGLGERVTFTFTVTNTGRITLSAPTITDPMLAAAGLSAPCAAATLAPGASTTCTSAGYLVTQADLDRGRIENVGRAAATTPAGGTVLSNDDSEVVQVPTRSALTLSKTVTDADGDGLAALGERLTFAIVVRNSGVRTVTGLVVEDSLDGGPAVAVTSCSARTLAPGATATCTPAPHVVTQADVDRGAVSNRAIAKGTDATGAALASNPDVAAIPTPNDPQIALRKTGVLLDSASGPAANGAADAGEVLRYTFTVENRGAVTLSDIVVTDTPPSATGGATVRIGCGTGALAPGARRTCTWDYAVTQADVDRAQGAAEVGIPNTATATGTTSTGTQVTTLPSTETLPAARPGLTVDKVAYVDGILTDAAAEVGQRITYRMTVTNTGAATLTGLRLDDTMTPQRGVTISCDQTTLPPGQSTTCRSTPYVVTQDDLDHIPAGVIDNTVTARATAGASTVTSLPDAAQVTLARDASLALIKRAAARSTGGAAATAVRAGDLIDYTFTVRNTGSLTVWQVAVGDPRVSGLNCPVTVLAPGQQITCTADAYSVSIADMATPLVHNEATVTGVSATGPVQAASASADVPTDPLVAVVLDKTAQDGDSNGVLDPDEAVTFRFTIRNTGGRGVTGLSVQDPWAAGHGLTISCPVVELAPGAATTCSAGPYPVTAADLTSGRLRNVATVRYSVLGGDGTVLESGAAESTTPMRLTAAMTLTKAVTDAGRDGRASVGEALTYTFVVTNTGTAALAGVRIEDPKLAAAGVAVTMPAGFDGTLAPGASVTATSGPYRVTAADAAAGRVTNRASARATGVLAVTSEPAIAAMAMSSDPAPPPPPTPTPMPPEPGPLPPPHVPNRPAPPVTAGPAPMTGPAAGGPAPQGQQLPATGAAVLVATLAGLTMMLSGLGLRLRADAWRRRDTGPGGAGRRPVIRSEDDT